MFGSSLRRREFDVDVWLNPAAGRSAAAEARALRRIAHLVVVPNSGSRRADVAVLLDPEPAELVAVAELLDGIPLLAATAGPPTAPQRAAARRAGAQVLGQATPDGMVAEVRALCRRAAAPPAAVPVRGADPIRVSRLGS